MNRLARRVLLLAPLVVLLLLAVSYLLLDAWQEGAGGRRAVERALAERLGLPVRLSGRFNVMLLPAIGVSGTDLVIGEPGASTEVVRSGRYAVALALLPLLDGELRVESFELAEGAFYLERLQAAGEPAGGDGAPTPLQLPEIQVLAVRDFAFYLGEGDPIQLERFALEDFTAGADAPFELAVGGLGAMEGELNWDAAGQVLGLEAVWSKLLPGDLRIRAAIGLAAGSGSLDAAWSPEPPSDTARLSVAYAMQPAGVRLSELRLEAGSQSVAGFGCLATGDAPAVHLELSASAIDLDALPDFTTLGQAFGASPAGAEPEPRGDDALALNLRLRADEARFRGALARMAEFQVGGTPDCTAVDGPTAAASQEP